MNVFSDEEGTIAVRIARRVIESTIRNENPGDIDVPKSFKDNGGVFTTILKFPSGDLRGCIGYSEPVMPIISAIVRSAKSAATRDIRFQPLRVDELDNVIFSVSLLTKPTRLLYDKAEDLPSLVTVGKHGLIIKKNGSGGLLLPQVPVEQDWNSEVFLNQTCVKAGLPHKTWRTKKVSIFTFTAEVFEETEPHGSVVRAMCKKYLGFIQN